MDHVGCISCDTVSGRFEGVGGIVYESPYWVIAMRQKPLLVASCFMILKRHCEDFTQLSRDELHDMADTMQAINSAYNHVLQPEKVHFALYGEGVKHIHWHITPRTANLPAGNIPLQYLQRWKTFLHRVGLAQPIADDALARIADELRVSLTD